MCLKRTSKVEPMSEKDKKTAARSSASKRTVRKRVVKKKRTVDTDKKYIEENQRITAEKEKKSEDGVSDEELEVGGKEEEIDPNSAEDETTAEEMERWKRIEEMAGIKLSDVQVPEEEPTDTKEGMETQGSSKKKLSSSKGLVLPQIDIGHIHRERGQKGTGRKYNVYIVTIIVAIIVGLSIFSYIRYSVPPTSYDTDDDGMPDKWENLYGLDVRDSKDRNKDMDGDGLSNIDEYKEDTLPDNPDTDGDKIPDGWEALHNMNPKISSDWILDLDSDGVEYTVNNITLQINFTARDEYIAGTDPNDPDSDDDIMLDGWENYFKLDPRDGSDSGEDNDGDSLTNIEEYEMGTNPSSKDTDSDELDDLVEIVTWKTDPLNSDTDGDLIFDGWEVKNKMDPLDRKDANLDPDNDNLTSWREFLHGTDPNNPDSDGDGMPDGWEIDWGRNSTTGVLEVDPSKNDGNLDADNDLLPNVWEFNKGTDPLNPDSDNDGLSDGAECFVGHRGKLLGGIYFTEDPDWIYFTDPLDQDTDGDGLSDHFEINNGINASNEDTDNDELEDFEEINTIHTFPFREDSDSDGLNDREEVRGTYGYLTNPLLNDTDEDGLHDGVEVLNDHLPFRGSTGPFGVHSTNPTIKDTDGDSIFDGWETDNGATRKITLIERFNGDVGLDTWFEREYVNLKYNWNGTDWKEFLDKDGDGLVDQDLPAVNIINPLLSEDKLLDPDGDDLPNYMEFSSYSDKTGLPFSTDPLLVDTDSDGMPDGWELTYITYLDDLKVWMPDPLKWDAQEDPDRDGHNYEIDGLEYYHPFVNIEEYWWSNFYPDHCDPVDPDVDSNSVTDGSEIWQHSYDGNIAEGDGLPNGWECLFSGYNIYIYGPNDYIPENIMTALFNPFEGDSDNDGIMDGNADPDEDDHINLEEFLRKTDPTDPNSVPSRTRHGRDRHAVELSLSLSNPGDASLRGTVQKPSETASEPFTVSDPYSKTAGRNDHTPVYSLIMLVIFVIFTIELAVQELLRSSASGNP